MMSQSLFYKTAGMRLPLAFPFSLSLHLGIHTDTQTHCHHCGPICVLCRLPGLVQYNLFLQVVSCRQKVIDISCVGISSLHISTEPILPKLTLSYVLKIAQRILIFLCRLLFKSQHILQTQKHKAMWGWKESMRLYSI